jgi:tetratricopeptide (TPR) repeat protein
MAKHKKRGRCSTGAAWTGFDHAIRSMKKQKKKEEEEDAPPSLSQRERRTMARTRDSKEKRDAQKLHLHITKTQREIDKLRERLENWDDVEEAKKGQREASNEPSIKNKKGRKGPETWKLRGAARPASEVYDFDTRYEDPHLKAHEEATAKAKRQRNVLAIYKGRLGDESSDDCPPQPHCRNLLALLMQLGMLQLEAKKYKAARAAFLECMELDGTEHPITSARARLMRLYLEANRPDSARRLWERLSNDTSAWIRYSAALVEYVSWKILGEEGSSQSSAEALLAQAIRSNVYCAFYIAFHDFFESVMEYTDEIEEADEGTLEEAIEYCNSEQWGAWIGTDGAVEWVLEVLLGATQGRQPGSEGGTLQPSDLEWKERLREIEQLCDREEGTRTGEEDEGVDVAMFAGMFRTAMEMVEDSGELVRVDLSESS